MADNSALSQDSESFIQHEIAIGTYRDRSGALEAAVALLRKQKTILDKLDEGRRQLDAGEFVEFDRDELRQFFESLKKRASKSAESE